MYFFLHQKIIISLHSILYIRPSVLLIYQKAFNKIFWYEYKNNIVSITITIRPGNHRWSQESLIDFLPPRYFLTLQPFEEYKEKTYKGSIRYLRHCKKVWLKAPSESNSSHTYFVHFRTSVPSRDFWKSAKLSPGKGKFAIRSCTIITLRVWNLQYEDALFDLLNFFLWFHRKTYNNRLVAQLTGISN